MKDLNYYKRLEYPFRVDPDPEGGFVASIPDLPGCQTFGESIEQAIQKLKEAKELWLESYFGSHGEAPEPARLPEYSGRFLLRLPKYLHKKLHESAVTQGVSMNQYILSLLAERETWAEMTRQEPIVEPMLGGFQTAGTGRVVFTSSKAGRVMRPGRSTVHFSGSRPQPQEKQPWRK